MRSKNKELEEWGEMMHKIMHPEERTFTLPDVAQRFSELPNKDALIKGFAKKVYARDEFCAEFNCPKWVFDFLSDTMKMRALEGRIWKHERHADEEA